MLRMSLCENHLDLRLTGATALLARRRRLRIPRERIHRAFVLGKSFAVNASPRVPCPGWASRRLRIGVFGFRDSAQLWSAGPKATVLALYLRGVPHQLVVYDVPDPYPRSCDDQSMARQTRGLGLDPQMNRVWRAACE